MTTLLSTQVQPAVCAFTSRGNLRCEIKLGSSLTAWIRSCSIQQWDGCLSSPPYCSSSKWCIGVGALCRFMCRGGSGAAKPERSRKKQPQPTGTAWPSGRLTKQAASTHRLALGQVEARVNRDDAVGQVRVAHSTHAGVAHHLSKLFLQFAGDNQRASVSQAIRKRFTSDSQAAARA